MKCDTFQHLLQQLIGDAVNIHDSVKRFRRWMAISAPSLDFVLNTTVVFHR